MRTTTSLLGMTLVAFVLGSLFLPARVDAAQREAVVYYNEACDECVTYVAGELTDLMTAAGIPLTKNDYINQRKNRSDFNALNDRLGVPLDLQSHLATFVDDGRIILQGEPPRSVVEALLTPDEPLPEKILVYGEEQDRSEYQVWAFAGPVMTYPADTPVSEYLAWFEANREGFATDVHKPAKLLLPTVLLTGLVDGINPCALAILLFFISFLFTIRKTRVSVIRMGAVYIGAVYVVYFLIGLGLLRASTLLKGHWLGQAGAILLILLGLTNMLGALFPKFPLRMKVPESSKESLKTWMNRATLPTTLVLGTLVGLHTFPCSGGPYVAVLGLLAGQTHFWQGVGYLVLYNVMFVLPLVVVLFLALDPVLGGKIQAWERSSSKTIRSVTGAIMVVLGLGLLLWVV
ncbi:cytochrome C biogenesis protein transmembrane region [bacterium BMS3Abin02]|nr:cytochrome C biogenesis protein transmembrane region [bacterium BMS3Abin02]GBE23301.1 cytochrome C biogenesis protein transmembrane region [bacterium BMS3Bbin01]